MQFINNQLLCLETIYCINTDRYSLISAAVKLGMWSLLVDLLVICPLYSRCIDCTVMLAWSLLCLFVVDMWYNAHISHVHFSNVCFRTHILMKLCLEQQRFCIQKNVHIRNFCYFFRLQIKIYQKYIVSKQTRYFL